MRLFDVVFVQLTLGCAVEFASVRRVDGKVVYHVYSKAELEALLKRAESMLLEQKKKQEKESVGDI